MGSTKIVKEKRVLIKVLICAVAITVGETKEKDTSLQDFNDFVKMRKGRWVSEGPPKTSWTAKPIEKGNGLTETNTVSFANKSATSTTLYVYQKKKKRIFGLGISDQGRMTESRLWRISANEWGIVSEGELSQGSFVARGRIIFAKDNKQYTIKSEIEINGRKLGNREMAVIRDGERPDRMGNEKNR